MSTIRAADIALGLAIRDTGMLGGIAPHTEISRFCVGVLTRWLGRYGAEVIIKPELAVRIGVELDSLDENAQQISTQKVGEGVFTYVATDSIGRTFEGPTADEAECAALVALVEDYAKGA